MVFPLGKKGRLLISHSQGISDDSSLYSSYQTCDNVRSVLSIIDGFEVNENILLIHPYYFHILTYESVSALCVHIPGPYSPNIGMSYSPA